MNSKITVKITNINSNQLIHNLQLFIQSPKISIKNKIQNIVNKTGVNFLLPINKEIINKSITIERHIVIILLNILFNSFYFFIHYFSGLMYTKTHRKKYKNTYN